MAQTDLVSDGSVELLLLLVTSRSGLRGLGLCDPKGARCYGVSARLRSHAVKAFTQSTYWKRGSSMVMPLNSSQRKQFSTDSYPTSCPPPQKKKNNTARLADTNPGCVAWRQSPRELPKFVPCSWAQHPSGLAGASSASLIAPSTRSPDHSLENPFSPPRALPCHTPGCTRRTRSAREASPSFGWARSPPPASEPEGGL